MIEYTTPTGTGGQLKVIDKTDDPDSMVAEAWILNDELDVQQLPWTYSIDGVMAPWRSINCDRDNDWQPLGIAHVGNAQTFTLHLGDTGTTELNGPTDLVVSLYGYIPESGIEDALVRVHDGVNWRRAVPYVNVEGQWKKAVPYIRTPTGWKQST